MQVLLDDEEDEDLNFRTLKSNKNTESMFNLSNVELITTNYHPNFDLSINQPNVKH